MRPISLVVAFLLLIYAAPITAQEKRKPNIAASDPLRPEEQAKQMKLPPGFELQLVAADPDIKKPININFDAAGRLWLTETIEYPFAAPEGKGRDAVKILEDFGPDGRARKITTFADKLNIPIGVLPTGNGTLVYSIPAIYRMSDSKGLGKADVREMMYGPFGYKDTHGMTGEFVQGFDGWIYACHGYANTSNVRAAHAVSGKGGDAITMTSGNTYRIKADGSRIEQWTWGQVNPFGMAFDPYGNLYTGDCHSQPLTMLLRHGWYISFNRPSDGLGFAPHMNTFAGLHSTALCGVAYYAADQYPKEYQGLLFLGDVVNNCINAYRLDWTGASPKAVLQNFLTSDDPWFRPVDIKLGPDGCLYFADFYNRIIGHYEVDLKHPGRDREKGRIWRIVYRGKDGKGPQPVVDLAKADVKTLVQALGSTNLTVRLQATQQLAERGGQEAAAALQRSLTHVADNGDAALKVHALWALERLGKLSDDTLLAAASSDKEVRIHVQRILTEKSTWSPKYAALAKVGLDDKEATVQRIAAEALAAHPAADQIEPILARRRKTPASDAHLVYALRLALRDQFRAGRAWQQVNGSPWQRADLENIADVCLAIPSEQSAEFLKRYLTETASATVGNVDNVPAFVKHIVRYGPKGSLAWIIDYAPRKYTMNPRGQAVLLNAGLQGAQERGSQPTSDETAAAQKIVVSLLQAVRTNDVQLGVELAGALKLASAQPQLMAMVGQAQLPVALRRACVVALVEIDAKQAIKPLASVLLNDKEAITIREQIANALAGMNRPEAHAALIETLQHAPARLQSTIALGMAGNAQGGDRLLQAIEAGKASPRLLQDRAIELRLQSAKIANVKMRLSKLTKGLPPADQAMQATIAKRRDAFTSFKADAEVGQKIFQKSCANCHQIAGQGAKVGPNLDGVGNRGLERLLEDVLDPNRNVDQAFRTTIVTTKGGQTLSGLFLREEGNIVILADKDGKDVRIEKSMIDERSLSPQSPMPANFLEVLAEPELHHLMAYLLSQRGKQ